MHTLLLALLIACGSGPTAADAITAAEAALSSQDYAGAQAKVSEGLATKPEAKERWRLEFIGLEALARAGKADEASAKLEALAALEGTPVRGSHYVSTADQLKNAGQAAGAIALLDKGIKRFADDADLQKALEQAKASGGTDELEALKSLGYLGE